MPNAAVPRRAGPDRRWLSNQLMDAVRTEQRLLDELARLLLQQRAAITSHDAEALDDATFGIQRLAQTLAEASRRMRIISRQVTDDGRLPFGEMVRALGLPQAPELLAARAEVREAARLLEAELRANRALLDEVLTREA